MTKKINSKLLISICLVAVLVICAFSMIACNKKKGQETNSGTMVSAVTGTTEISVDNVEKIEAKNVFTDYTHVSLDYTKYTKLNEFVLGSGNMFWIIKDNTPKQINSIDTYNYSLYNPYEGTIIKTFDAYYYLTRNYYGSGYNKQYTYLLLATIEYNSTDSNYVYTGAAYDLFGNAFTAAQNETSASLYTGENSNLFYSLDIGDDIVIENTLNTDASGNFYINAKFYNETTHTLSNYKIDLDSYEIEPATESASIPTYSVGNKYIEKTEVPGLSGYYYYESKSTNSILFYNNFTASSPTSTLSLDFGQLDVKFDTNYIVGGKVFIYGKATLPEAASDYDYLEASIFGTLKGKTVLYVYDIASGTLKQIMKGYGIDEKFVVFSANKKAFISIEAFGITADKLINPTSMYYVLNGDGDIVVSTPELFDPQKITAKLSNNYYIYDGEDYDYLLDNCLNVAGYLNNLDIYSDKALVTLSSDNSTAYLVDTAGTIKYVANVAEYSSHELFGDYLLATKNNGDMISIKVGEAEPDVIHEGSDTTVQCLSLGGGIYAKFTVTGATTNILFVNCNNTQIGASINVTTGSSVTGSYVGDNFVVTVTDGNPAFYIFS